MPDTSNGESRFFLASLSGCLSIFFVIFFVILKTKDMVKICKFYRRLLYYNMVAVNIVTPLHLFARINWFYVESNESAFEFSYSDVPELTLYLYVCISFVMAVHQTCNTTRIIYEVWGIDTAKKYMSLLAVIHSFYYVSMITLSSYIALGHIMITVIDIAEHLTQIGTYLYQWYLLGIHETDVRVDDSVRVSLARRSLIGAVSLFFHIMAVVPVYFGSNSLDFDFLANMVYIYYVCLAISYLLFIKLIKLTPSEFGGIKGIRFQESKTMKKVAVEAHSPAPSTDSPSNLRIQIP